MASYGPYTFTGADSPSVTGGSFTAYVGTWGIASNHGYKSATDSVYGYLYHDSGTSDVEVECTWTTWSDNTGLFVRGGATEADCIGLFIGGGTWTLYSIVSGSGTSLTSGAYSSAHGDIWTLTANGTALEVFQNAVSMGTTTSASGQTNTRHGMIAIDSFPRFDDFTITDIGGGGGGAPWVPAYLQMLRANQ
jgi:hypothetical protein